MKVFHKHWLLQQPFENARNVVTTVVTTNVEMTNAEGITGRGEAFGVDYKGETPASLLAQIEQVKDSIEQGAGREDVLSLLPDGGARYAIDSALWDLEAKVSGHSVFQRAGIQSPKPVTTAYTIGIQDLPGYESEARERSDYPLLKVKVRGTDILDVIEAVRRGNPNADLILDPNQSWSVPRLQEIAPQLAKRGVVLLEQPIAVGDEAGLEGYTCPIPLCADELIDGIDDLDKAQGRFQVINIKLDKTGGLTRALELAAHAQARGFDLMVGCMFGSSLTMAPALVLAQKCKFVDLDGPLLQVEDWPGGLNYHNGRVWPAEPEFWG
ncbi:MAG: dipeptide epimerase [Henriciella sp.]|nr:dipeptide epimerase [Henriciella sp.]